MKLKLFCGRNQEPITRSMQLPYNRVTAFSQTCLFLDRTFDKFRLPREPRLLITSFANLIIKISVIKSPWRFCQWTKRSKMCDKCMESTDDSAGKKKLKAVLKINWSVKTPWHRLSMGVTRSGYYEILWCDHSNETSSAVLLHGIICFSIFYKMKFGISVSDETGLDYRLFSIWNFPGTAILNFYDVVR